MALSFFKKNNAKDTEASASFQKQTKLTDSDVQRLAESAGSFVAMFEESEKDPEKRLMLAAGMAGYACHQAVI